MEHIRQFVLGSKQTDWEPAYGRVAGTLPLDELRPVDKGDKVDKPTVLILQGEINVSAAGRATVLITSTEPLQSWFDADSFDTKKQFDIELTPGRHVITLRVEVSTREAPELRVEFKTPNDSPANYEVIGGS